MVPLPSMVLIPILRDRFNQVESGYKKLSITASPLHRGCPPVAQVESLEVLRCSSPINLNRGRYGNMIHRLNTLQNLFCHISSVDLRVQESGETTDKQLELKMNQISIEKLIFLERKNQTLVCAVRKLSFTLLKSCGFHHS
jgi:hypothetical protein